MLRACPWFVTLYMEKSIMNGLACRREECYTFAPESLGYSRLSVIEAGNPS